MEGWEGFKIFKFYLTIQTQNKSPSEFEKISSHRESGGLNYMKNIIKFATVALVAGALSAEAQVKYRISRSEDFRSYTVSMIPEKSLKGNESIVGTMQITMKTKAESQFAIGRITSHIADAEWENASILRSPKGGEEFDYVSINLRSMGSRAFDFKEGSEIKLFTIENVGNDDQTALALIENDDNLIKNGKGEYNVKNHISVLGYGRRNAYNGNAPIDLMEELVNKIKIQKIYPNPAVGEEVTVEWQNLDETQKGELLVVISDANGRELLRKPTKLAMGQQSLRVAVGELEEGTYLVGLMKDGVKLGNVQKLHVSK
jgi:hypothetical protein